MKVLSAESSGKQSAIVADCRICKTCRFGGLPQELPLSAMFAGRGDTCHMQASNSVRILQLEIRLV